jgi:hypothetical protein
MQQTALSDLNGPSKILEQHLKTLFGRMRQACRLKVIAAFIATREEASPGTNAAPSTLLKSTFGLGLAKIYTGVYIFDGIMDAPMYTRILESYLIPFIHDVYPTSHRFMQDNDPKYTFHHA